MTTETEEGQSFAAFEAATLKGDEPDTQPEGDEPNPETNDELELTEEDELVEEEGEKPEKRHKSAKQRIDELTKARREAERERDELRARLEGNGAVDQPTLADLEARKPDPNALNADGSEKYQFGDADPQYQEDLMDWKVEVKLAKRDAAERAEAGKAEAKQTLVSLDEGWAAAEARGAEKYDDFGEAIEAYQTGLPEVPALLNIAIQASPVAEDAAYHLGKNIDVARLIAAELNGGDPMSAARRFGEIEGQYLDKAPEAPSANAHPIDHALYAGRLRTFTEKAKEAKPEPKRVTSAPEPVRHNLRGGGGQFSVADDTDDFAAFEKKVMGGR